MQIGQVMTSQPQPNRILTKYDKQGYLSQFV